MTCPTNAETCPCPEYSKEGLCDYPYRNDMAEKEIRETRAKENSVANKVAI